MKIVFIDQNVYKDFAHKIDIIAPLERMGEVTAYDDLPVSEEELYSRAWDADVIILSIHQLRNGFIEKFKKLKLIQFMGIGYRNYMDEDFCASRGIKAMGIGEYGSNAVAEYTLGLVLALFRGITEGDRRLKNEVWDMQGLLGREIAGSTFGIVGTGAIGRLVARKATLLGARVLAHDLVENRELVEKHGVEYVDLKTLFAKSDLVSCHLIHTKATEKLVSGELLSSMKEGSFFVNTSRAQVVDYDALYELLKKKHLRGAALDVHYSEPPEDYSLAKLENVIATPHLGYYTEMALENQLRKVVESVVAHID
jgi:phosphoglycerate dehydrogenase-like enzyme